MVTRMGRKINTLKSYDARLARLNEEYKAVVTAREALVEQLMTAIRSGARVVANHEVALIEQEPVKARPSYTFLREQLGVERAVELWERLPTKTKDVLIVRALTPPQAQGVAA
jgi:hypothetical protein